MSEVLILSGKSGHGKDFTTDIIYNKLIDSGYSVMIIHYADLLKFYCKTYYEWDGNKDKQGRELLQHIGNDIVRSHDNDYWVDCVTRFIAAIGDEFDVYIIPDARYVNEIECTKNVFPQAKTIRITRYDNNGNLYINPSLTKEQCNHSSETALDEYNVFDYFLENTTTNSLKEGIDTILNDIGFII